MSRIWFEGCGPGLGVGAELLFQNTYLVDSYGHDGVLLSVIYREDFKILLLALYSSSCGAELEPMTQSAALSLGRKSTFIRDPLIIHSDIFSIYKYSLLLLPLMLCGQSFDVSSHLLHIGMLT